MTQRSNLVDERTHKYMIKRASQSCFPGITFRRFVNSIDNFHTDYRGDSHPVYRAAAVATLLYIDDQISVAVAAQ